MKKIYSYLLLAFTLLAVNKTTAQDLIITGIFDGPLSGGTPKTVELYVVNNIADLSTYGIGSANNGGGSDGEEFTFPADPATAGDYIHLTSNLAEFNTYFGFSADYDAGSVTNVNGDDAIELFFNGNVIDVFGDINVDGTGEPWEYLDGWAYRVDATGPDGTTFNIGNWTFSGANAVDGCADNASCASEFPIGTYELVASTIPEVNVSPSAASINEGAGNVNVGSINIAPAVTNPSSFEVHLIGGTGDVSDLIIGGGATFPITVPVTAAVTSLPLELEPNDDTMNEGNETLIFAIRNVTGDLTLGDDSIFTVTIIDNDLPLTDIATVSAGDANGNPTNINNTYRVVGVVNSPERGFAGIEFSIQDASGAITVYDPTSASTYVAEVGDSVEVFGTVGQVFGVTVIRDITSLVELSTGATVTEVVSSVANESNESSLIRINDVTLVDESQWVAAGGSGFDVAAYTVAGDSVTIRIDRDYADLFNSTPPCDTFDIIGVVGQFDVDSPFTEGYQILPRFEADILGTPCPQASVTIADATETDSNGDPVLFGDDVVLRGIVTSPDYRVNQGGVEFTFSDGTGGIWAYSSDSVTGLLYDPVVGDSIVVEGNIGAASGVTRIFIDTLFSPGPATALTPTIVTVALEEIHEAELITIENLTLNGAWNSSGGSYNVNATSDNGITYDIRVDADRAELFTVPLTGNDKFNLTGVGSQFDPSAPRTEGYTIMPRFDSDIEITVGINDLALNNFSLSPVPAKDVLTVAFDFEANEIAQFELVDMMGRTVSVNKISLVNGNNTNTINVATLSAGIYVLKITSSMGINSTNIIVE